MPFIYKRTVRFQETDAAGVVYFANILAICHEAYEASLAESGVNLQSFFCYPKIAIPITNVSADFFQPMFCGDRQTIQLMPRQISNSNFEINYEIYLEGNSTTQGEVVACAAKATSQHVCIHTTERVRTSLPPDINRWLQQWGKTIEVL